MSGVGLLLSRLRIREVGSRLINLNVVAARPTTARTILQSNVLKVANSRSVTTKSTKSTSAGKTTAAKKAAAKKPAAKKPAAKRPAAKKAPAKKGPAKKAAKKTTKKPAVKKKVAKKTPAKLTPEEKERKKEIASEKKLKAKKAEMKALILDPPSEKPDVALSGYSMYLAEKMKGSPPVGFKDFHTNHKWENVPEAEKQKYEDLAKARKESIKQAYTAFVESYTPATIRQANTARRWLKKHEPHRSWPLIVDHRIPKTPLTAFMFFMKDLHHSGELASLKMIERAKEGGARWKAMSDAEKRPFNLAAEAEKNKYQQEKVKLG